MGCVANVEKIPHLFHLSLRYTAAIINDTGGLETGGFVELDEKLADHVGQILDDLLAEQLLLEPRKQTKISVIFINKCNLDVRATLSTFTCDMSCRDVCTRTVAQ